MFIQLKCVGHTKDYLVDKTNFINKIKNYALSFVDDRQYYLHLFYVEDKSNEIEFGMQITDKFLIYIHLMRDYIKNAKTTEEIERGFSQYFAFHMYAEFHKGLFKRLQFYGDGKLNQELLHDYKVIPLKAEKIRINFIKSAMHINRGDKVKSLKLLDSIEEDLIYIKNSEKAKLELVISKIEI